MNTDSVVSCLLEARDGVRDAKAEAAAAGIDRDFDELINQIDLFIYAIQTGSGCL